MSLLKNKNSLSLPKSYLSMNGNLLKDITFVRKKTGKFYEKK